MATQFLKIRPAGEAIWELESRADGRVPARFIATHGMLDAIREDRESLEQLRNVATLPGALGSVWAMPDVHMGYGFPIGGVAATDAERGVISPGGVGYDINCGVRLLAFALQESDIRARLPHIADLLYAHVPCGVGRGGDVRAAPHELQAVLARGAAWAVERGFGDRADIEHVEEQGCMGGADPAQVSARALERGKDQLGTLGSGNHFMEVGVVDELYDQEAARAFGLRVGQVTLLLHSGSRGLGHQVCTDFLKTMEPAMVRHRIQVPDRQLCCVPLESPEGRAYLGAMNAAVNFAFANRQILAGRAVKALCAALEITPRELGARTVYEIAHNIAKLETHVIAGKPRRVCVHRKGATRAFPAGHADVPADYRDVGQPVLIPGDMERYSYVLVGTAEAMRLTFGSTCHGAGRRLSRTAARKQERHRAIARELEDRGIHVRSANLRTQQEETAAAYKDVADVVDAVVAAGISRKVARLRPLVVVKG
jgi:tRNA-splicing ligase RtcB